MKDIRVRVDGHHEAPGGKVRVSFTSRPAPKKAKDGMIAMPSVDDDYFNMDRTMSKSEAEAYPVGHRCKVTMAPDDSGDDDEPEPKEEKSSRAERLEKAAYAAAEKK